MNTREIEVLIEKYYEAETSLAEEKVLRDFFSNPGVPAHLLTHQALFTSFAGEQMVEMDDAGFETVMEERLAAETRETPVVTLRRHPGRFLFISGIAASVLLVIGLFFTFREDVLKSGKPGGAADQNAMAYAETTEALLIVSSNLNRGLREVSHLGAFDKAMKNMEQFNKFYQCETIIINPDAFNKTSKK